MHILQLCFSLVVAAYGGHRHRKVTHKAGLEPEKVDGLTFRGFLPEALLVTGERTKKRTDPKSNFCILVCFIFLFCFCLRTCVANSVSLPGSEP